MYKYAFILVAIFTLSACQERYRYPCQDIENVHKKECSKEYCSYTRDCPEHNKKGP